jgi:hypothetical protein
MVCPGVDGINAAAACQPSALLNAMTDDEEFNPLQCTPIERIERIVSLLSASPVGEARCRCRKVWLTRIDYYY